jgi:hypothetical protein
MNGTYVGAFGVVVIVLLILVLLAATGHLHV